MPLLNNIWSASRRFHRIFNLFCKLFECMFNQSTSDHAKGHRKLLNKMYKTIQLAGFQFGKIWTNDFAALWCSVLCVISWVFFLLENMSVIDNFPQILEKSQRWQVRQQYDTDLLNLPSRSIFTSCGNLALCTRYFEIVADIQTRKRQESIGPRTADCPTFVTRSGPHYSSFALHAKDEIGRSLLQYASTVLRLHCHLIQLFINTPQRQVPTCVCWTVIYHSSILPPWRDIVYFVHTLATCPFHTAKDPPVLRQNWSLDFLPFLQLNYTGSLWNKYRSSLPIG